MSKIKTISWREEITRVMKEETWDDVEFCTLSDEELNRQFDSSWGSANGKPFLLWTKKHVYFAAEYDGSEWAERVPRNPVMKADIYHIGG